ncbi:hypothetical protein TESG_06328 [Trichophyton tonsurans CBS 112818]|uniref:Uncharacterized protein n=1 Tax=Trichophyton tonsurans (strain CBS 112818) TaxID=647933 RepID=F2S5W6_TRIT1|nr:hypothetical protein TESG_06328 [Trichophyton tonsurans CBS 112818]
MAGSRRYICTYIHHHGRSGPWGGVRGGGGHPFIRFLGRSDSAAAHALRKVLRE